MFSILDMFSIGVGPSSSHTVGPMRAARAFALSLRERGLLERVDGVRVVLYGSLSLTGLGHGTDRAVILGLEGAAPETADTARLADIHAICDAEHAIDLAGTKRIGFERERDIAFDMWRRLAAHPNGMRLSALDASGATVDEQVWYSVGGGFVRRGGVDDPIIGNHERMAASEEASAMSGESETADASDGSADFAPGTPYPFRTCDELIAHTKATGLSIARIVMANEAFGRTEGEVRAELARVWRVMRECVRDGCSSTQRVLPGGLDVPRRAPRMYERLSADSDVLRRDLRRRDTVLERSDAAWVDLFALAVSEENAGGGRVVTAPTNGSAGVIPAVLHYYWHFVETADEEGVFAFLLTAGAIGYLFKRNASISGAEVGCQGEVGVACSMAAAGLAAVMGGTPAQVENAAEIGIEHNLGLTCDPVGGLVQIPCIERNAMAANTAINAVRMAMLGDGTHIVTLDQAIRTMKETGEDMMAKYKETSKGGLAVNVVEC